MYDRGQAGTLELTGDGPSEDVPDATADIEQCLWVVWVGGEHQARLRSKTPAEPTSRPASITPVSSAERAPGAQKTTTGTPPTASSIRRRSSRSRNR